MARSKQSVSLEDLQELGKTHLSEPNSRLYNNDDLNVVVSGHVTFLRALALRTQRLNPVSMRLAAKELFKMSNREAQQYAEGLCRAFSYCISAGSKATTGEKLSKDVVAVFNASQKSDHKARSLTPEQKVKQEVVKQEVKKEHGSPPRPTKSLKKCLSSPSEIAKLYMGSAPSSSFINVKVVHWAC